jgi:6-phosphofructokinase
MKIGILTGGGDIPGLNSSVKALVWRALDEGHEVLGFRLGWRGPLNYNPDDPTSLDKYTIKLDKINTRKIDRSGGTFLHSSRTNPWKMDPESLPEHLKDNNFKKHKSGLVDATPAVINNLESLGIDVLVPIGGDDTLGYAARLFEEGFPVISIPKTMDNDVFGTDYCLGFSTAITRSVQFIHQLRTSTGSHERIAIIELFGRYSGQTALISAYLAGADRCIISEVPFDPEKLSALLVKDREINPSNYSICVISEGAQFENGDMLLSGDADAFGHRKLGGIGIETGEIIKKYSGVNIINQTLAYLMRSGAPDSLDMMVANTYANMVMDLIGRGNFGHMVALQDGLYTYVPANIVTQGIRRVDVDELYDIKQYRPKIRKAKGKPMFLY